MIGPSSHQGRVDPIDAQGGQEGQRAPPPVRRLGDQTLAPLRAAMAPRHVRLHPGLIDEDQPTWRQPALILLPARTPAGHVRPVLFGCVQAFFLNVMPCAFKEVPDRVVADHDAARRQLRPQRPQRQVRLLGKPR